MLKKIYSMIALVVGSLALFACAPTAKEVQLPILNGMNASEITETLENLGFEIEIHEERIFSVPKGLFVRYGEGKAPGLKVDPSAGTLIIYIATHDIILPDLAGLNETQIKDAFKGLPLTLSFTYQPTTEVDEGIFISYAGTFAPGNAVYQNTNIPIILASYPDSYRSPIFISKYVSGTGNNKALEIFNGLDNEVDLSGYTIDFYLNGSLDATHTYTIEEGTKLGSKDTLLLVHPDADQELVDKADVLTNTLTFDGNDYMTLNDHRDAMIDEYGRYGIQLYFNSNRITVRKPNIIESSLEYEINDWDIYYRTHYEILDSHPTQFPETFTYLPEYLEIDFSQPKGMLKVTYDSNNDGDTARFKELTESVRFVGINTREVSDPDPAIRALALAAGTFVRQRLSNATEIYIQHDPVSGITETYGRNLGLVWYDGKLVNYEVVLFGHSENMYADTGESFVYNGVTLNEWFRRAESYARANRLGVWA